MKLSPAGYDEDGKWVPENLERWTRPSNYIGDDWPEMYVFLGTHRDAGSITRSNYACAVAELERLDPDAKWHTEVEENHWAVGWVGWIGIRHDAPENILRWADECMSALEDYPVMDDEALSELEYNEAAEYWERSSLQDRLDMLRYDCGEHVSVFAIRRDEIPSLDYGAIVNAC